MIHTQHTDALGSESPSSPRTSIPPSILSEAVLPMITKTFSSSGVRVVSPGAPPPMPWLSCLTLASFFLVWLCHFFLTATQSRRLQGLEGAMRCEMACQMQFLANTLFLPLVLLNRMSRCCYTSFTRMAIWCPVLVPAWPACV